MGVGRPVEPQRRSFILSDEIRGTPIFDREAIKDAYDRSEYVEWIPFCRSVNLDWKKTKAEMPTAVWVQEKRQRLHQEQGELLADEIFRYKGSWHTEVLRTLREYPHGAELAYVAGAKLLHRMNSSLDDGSFDKKYKPKDLAELIRAMDVAISAKHRSLLLNHWEVRRAEEDIKAPEISPSSEPMKIEWKMELMNGQQMTASQLQQLIESNLDPEVEPDNADNEIG